MNIDEAKEKRLVENHYTICCLTHDDILDIKFALDKYFKEKG